MELKDCDCGGTPAVTSYLNGNKEFVIGCTACGNQTPICDSLKEAVTLWNKALYCFAEVQN